MTLSQRDLSRLEGLHVDLVRVVRAAVEAMPPGLSFMVVEGLRTPERQRELVATGASQTLASRHLTGHAIDLAPLVGGGLRWDWPLFYRLADAVAHAANQLFIPLTWGGCWDKPVFQWNQDAEEESLEYAARRRAIGKKPFLDGPHFELPSKDYP